MIEFTRNEIAHLTAALLPQPACGQDYRIRFVLAVTPVVAGL